MTELKTKMEVQGIDQVKTLIDLLDNHRNELPKPVLDGLLRLADCDVCEITTGNVFDETGMTHPLVFCDDQQVNDVVSINKVLRRIKFWNKDSSAFQPLYSDFYPSACYLKCPTTGNKKVLW